MLYRKPRFLSQRNYRLLQEIRAANDALKQRDAGMTMKHRTLTAAGEVVSVGQTIEAVREKEGNWAA